MERRTLKIVCIVSIVFSVLAGSATPVTAEAPPIGEAAASYESLSEVISAPWYDNERDPDVLRLYQSFFGRDPDPNGAAYWIGERRNGQDILQLAHHFSASQEFYNNYHGTSNHDFVSRVYRNVLGRDYDEEGFNYWLNLVDSGQLKRADMVFYVSAGAEFAQRFPYTSAGYQPGTPAPVTPAPPQQPDPDPETVAPDPVDAPLVSSHEVQLPQDVGTPIGDLVVTPSSTVNAVVETRESENDEFFSDAYVLTAAQPVTTVEVLVPVLAADEDSDPVLQRWDPALGDWVAIEDAQLVTRNGVLYHRYSETGSAPGAALHFGPTPVGALDITAGPRFVYRSAVSVFKFVFMEIGDVALRGRQMLQEWRGYRGSAPKCVNPVPNANDHFLTVGLSSDEVLVCAEDHGDRLFLKIVNNRSVPYMVDYPASVEFAGSWHGDNLHKAIIKHSNGKLLAPAGEVWVTVPKGSVHELRFNGSPAFQISYVTIILAVEYSLQILDQLTAKLTPNGHPLHGTVETLDTMFSCAGDLARGVGDLSTISPELIGGVVACIELQLLGFVRAQAANARLGGVPGWGITGDQLALINASQKVFKKVTIGLDIADFLVASYESVRAPRSFQVRIGEFRLRIPATTVPNAKIGQHYSFQFTAAGGSGIFTWKVLPGSSLPPGLTLSASGRLSGTPLEASTGDGFRISLVATDSGPGARDIPLIPHYRLVVEGNNLSRTVIDTPSHGSWYVDGRGFRHRIPDNAVRDCLVRQGAARLTVGYSQIEPFGDREAAKCVEAVPQTIYVDVDNHSYLLTGDGLRPIPDVPTFGCLTRAGTKVVRGVPRYWVEDQRRGTDYTQNCLVRSQTLGKMVQDETGRNWYIDLRGDRHHVPNGGVYECLVAQGKTMIGVFYTSAINGLGAKQEDAACVRVNSGQLAVHPDGDAYLLEDGKLRHVTSSAAFNCLVAMGHTRGSSVTRYWIHDQPRGTAYSNFPCNKIHTVAGNSYFIDGSAVRHWIADQPTFWCLSRTYPTVASTQATVNARREGSWADCFHLGSVEGKMLRVVGRGDISFIAGSGRRHWVADTITRLCLESRGHPLVDVRMTHYVDHRPEGNWAECFPTNNQPAPSYMRNKVLIYVNPQGRRQDWHYIDGSGIRHWIPDNMHRCIASSMIYEVRHRQQIDRVREGAWHSVRC